jgi:putative restriction endonuclease
VNLRRNGCSDATCSSQKGRPTVTVPSALATRLEKTAVDNGFDEGLSRQADWLAFASSRVPLRIWLSVSGDGRVLFAFSQDNVARALSDYSQPADVPMPPSAAAVRSVSDIPALHHLLRRAFQLSRALPDELLREFHKQVTGLPRTTEIERLVIQRVGQDVFRSGLLDYWESRCAITGLAVPELLRAGHIKPWAACASDAERLDVFNGFLLAPHLDAAFDCGIVSVSATGDVLVSERLNDSDRRLLGLDVSLHVTRLEDGHHPYLQYHRDNVFKPL